MAETTVYTCDICKQSKSRDDLAKITVKADGIKFCDTGYNGIKIDICPDCLKRKGFVVKEKPTKEEIETLKKQNKATLEDKIYEILEDMGVAFQE